MKPKKIGILGGMGPEATILFSQAVLQRLQKKIPEIALVSISPDHSLALRSFDKIIPQVKTALRSLQTMGSQLIAIPCNTAFCHYEELQADIEIPIVHLVHEIAKKASQSKLKRFGLLATAQVLESRIFQQALEKHGIASILPQDPQTITEIVLRIVHGTFLPADRDFLRDVISAMGAEGIVLGCTDLSVLRGHFHIQLPLFDSVEILAEATVRKSFCLHEM